MSQIPFEFPNKTKVMSLLASVYEDPRVALAEFIVNSMDAGASVVALEAASGKINSISVRDDGCGMSEGEMERVVRNLGNSIKTNEDELRKRRIDPSKVIGKMGIGILGYQSFARKAVFISKIDDGGAVWRLSMEAGKPNAEILPALLRDKERLADVPHGTVVELVDISRDIMRLFSRRTLQQYLEKNFADLLRRDGAAAVMIGGDRVVPPPLAGTPFSLMAVPIGEYGRVDLSLSIVASGVSAGDGVAVSSKGRVVVKEIIRIPEFQHSPWTDGVLHGSVEAPFLTVAPTRGMYIRNDGFEAFVRGILSIESRLSQEVEQARARRAEEQQSNVLRRLREAVGLALRDLELEAARSEAHRPGGPGTTERSGSTPGEHKGAHEGGSNHRPPSEGAERRQNRSQLYLEWQHLGTPVHSKLGEGGRIILNYDCPEYAEECAIPSGQRAYRYITKLVAKELAKRNYGDADTDEVMEQAVEIELRILKYLGFARD
ncbi:ATP-binding protein [Candidatus Cryosericum septentrionale]|jgi:hypothetical protein|nr:ATP-binding protein [Candidatus Cryosericum septentrionale]